MQIKAIIFERDNILTHINPGALADMQARIARVAPAVPPGTGRMHWSTWPGPWPQTPGDEPAFWRNFWGKLGPRYQLSRAAIDGLVDISTTYYTCYAPFPDAPRVLRALRHADLRLAVLTNFELPSIDRTLDYVGINPGWFDTLLSAVALGAPKPSIATYCAAADALNLPPEECLLVDHLPINVEGARLAGMHSVLLDRSQTTAAPQAFAGLEALADYLAHSRPS